VTFERTLGALSDCFLTGLVDILGQRPPRPRGTHPRGATHHGVLL